MLKKHMAACLVATAMMATPAFAQTAPSGSTDRPTASGSGTATSGSPAMQPSTGSTMGGSTMGTTGAPASGMSTTSGSTAPSPTASSGSGASGSASGATGDVVTMQQPGQMLASKLIGTTVVGANNESIGDVNDVLVDRGGQVQAVVIGVGGFLGIGEKDVAIPFRSVEFTTREQAPSGAAGSGAGTGGAAGTAGTAGTTGATNSSTGTGSGAANAERVMVRMSKQDLQNAPAFRRAGAAETSGNRGTSGAAPATQK